MIENRIAPHIKNLFEPNSVAVIGASFNTKKVGHKVLKNIISGGYKGKIYPVNPQGGKLLEHKVYQSVLEVKEAIDVAVIVIPESLVLAAAEESGRAGVKFLIVITSGFSEIGNDKDERTLLKIGQKYRMRILGPNVFGIYSAKSMLNATFSGTKIKPGHLAIISQSGALGIGMIGKTKSANLGLSSIISIGNMVDISTTELLEYLIADPETKTIFLYLEGIREGREPLEILKKAACKKPIIVIKAGRSVKGAQAAASHTGSLAVPDKVFDDLARQAGLLRAETITQGINWCSYLQNPCFPLGDNTVVITNGGGIGVLATDAAEKYDLPVWNNEKELKALFSQAVPKFGSCKNPIDLTGQAVYQDYSRALSIALKSPKIGSVVCLACETAVFDYRDFLRLSREIYSTFKQCKPIVFAYLGEVKNPKDIVRLKIKGTPIFEEVYQAVATLSALKHFQKKRTSREEIARQSINTEFINQLASQALKDKRNTLLPGENDQLAGSLGIKLPANIIIKSEKEAIRVAEKIGFPVVLKIVSPDILHKTDIGGVFVDLIDKKSVASAYRMIIRNCRQKAPKARIRGILVCEMVQKGVPVIVGGRKDKTFGPIVMVGSGGIYVEIIKDIAFRSFPLSEEEVYRMIQQTKIYSLLLGKRGQPPKDIQKLCKTILTIGEVVDLCPQIKELEINPLMVRNRRQGVMALDLRVIL